MKGQSLLIPRRQRLDLIPHHIGHGAHRDQVKKPLRDVGRDPQRQPVVAEVDHGIGFRTDLKSDVEEAWQQASAGDQHRGFPIEVLPAGLIQTLGGQQLHGLAALRQPRALRSDQADPVASIHQPLEQ